MQKTTLYLEDGLYERLVRLAADRGVTQALILREALTDYVAGKRQKPRSVGLGRSGKRLKGRLSERAEELLEGMGVEK